MADLFGFRFTRIKDDKGSEKITPPTSEDGTIDVAGGGFFGQVLDTEGRERTENDLIRRYRDSAQQPECDSAIEDIINESIGRHIPHTSKNSHVFKMQLFATK